MTIRIHTSIAALLLVVGAGSALAADGAALYKSHCAMCHGATGMADSPTGKAMKAPALAGDAKIAALPDPELVAKIKSNAKHPATVKSMSDADLTALAAYIKQLAPAK